MACEASLHSISRDKAVRVSRTPILRIYAARVAMDAVGRASRVARDVFAPKRARDFGSASQRARRNDALNRAICSVPFGWKTHSCEGQNDKFCANLKMYDIVTESSE